MSKLFKITSEFEPMGDQKKAIDFLTEGVIRNEPHQTLLGVTGSGKTFTMAKIIETCQRPSLIIAHNKTLAAQLYREFKWFFPNNSVHYFVSYYDYYQPEAYLPTTDTYIEKDSSINEELDRFRHAATKALFERRDTIIISSVSCIFGLGAPVEYLNQMFKISIGMKINRRRIMEKLVDLQYSRNDSVLIRGKFRVRGDTLEIYGAGDEDALRIELFGDEIDSLAKIDPLRGKVIEKLEVASIFPATHYVTSPNRMPTILSNIRKELTLRLKRLEEENKLLERQRLAERTEYDLEMLELTGFCSGIENYSRHLTGRIEGEPPPVLLDYYPEDFLLFIDESHATIPQLNAMYRGDRSRKQTLVEHGFRLPSALDNRPLKFEEFQKITPRVIYVSATPSRYEYSQSQVRVVEQLIRPTGLLDPEVEVRPAMGQVDDLYNEIMIRAQKNERTLVTTLTKKMAEDLTDYFQETGLKVGYLHSEVDTLDRIKIIRDLRTGKYDALIGINLLREGLDLPEVTLVAILDADQEGFLRSITSLVQTIGRCARNINGKAIMYADRITESMKNAISETNRRRQIQFEFNQKMGITPQSIQKQMSKDAFEHINSDYSSVPIQQINDPKSWTEDEFIHQIADLEREMYTQAKELKFEEAAQIRDKIKEIRNTWMSKRR